MKRLMALALVCLLALGGLAQAEEYSRYVHPDIGYELDYPRGWIVVSADTLQEIFDQLKKGELKLNGTSEQALQGMLQQAGSQPIVSFMRLDGKLNFNLNYTENPQYLQATTQMLLKQLPPALEAQYKSIFQNLVVLRKASLVKAGKQEYMRMDFAYRTQDAYAVMSQLFTLGAHRMYVFTASDSSPRAALTEEAEALVQRFLQSFKLP